MAGECLCFRARRLSRVLTRLYDDALRPLGVQATQLMLLNAIAMSDEGGVAMHVLADFLAMDRTTLSRNVRPLERAGWVRVARSPADGRARLLLLTPAGRRLVEAAAPLWRQAHDRVLAVLGAEAAAELRGRLDAALAVGGVGAGARPGGGVD